MGCNGNAIGMLVNTDNLESRGDEGSNQSQVAQPRSLVLSPEALQAIISSAALANLNLNGAQQQSAPAPAVRLSDVSDQIPNFSGSSDEDIDNCVGAVLGHFALFSTCVIQ
ncbi:hypothetical protein CBL_08533 [Carabus blaptoides fortunei]